MSVLKKEFFSIPLLFLLLLNIVPSAFLANLTFDNAPEVYLPPQQPGVVLKNQLLEIFPGDQNAVFLFQGDNLYSNEFLENLEAAVKSLKKSSLIEKVVNITEIEHIESTEDGFEVSALLGADKRKELSTTALRFQYARSDNIAKDLLVSKNMNLMAVMIRPYKLSSTTERIAVMKLVEDTFNQYNLTHYIVASAGPLVIEVEQFQSMIEDMLLFVPGTVLMGLILIWFMYRRILAVVIGGLVTGAVVNSALLMYVLFSLPFTMITSILSPLLASLTTAFLIHFYNSMQLASSYDYKGKKRVEYALDQIKKPVFFTALTTVLGLSSLSVSPILPITHLGLVAAFGVILLCLLVLWVVPKLFILFDDKSWPRAVRKNSFLDNWLKLIVTFSIRRSGWVVAVFITIFVLGIPSIMTVTAETNLLKFFPDEHVVIKETRMFEDNLSGVMPLEIIFYGASRDSFKKSDQLAKIEQLQNWLDKQPEVDKTTSLINFIKEMHKAFNGNESENIALPSSNPLISQYFFIYDGNDVYELVNREFDQTRIVISLHEHNSDKLRDIIGRINNYIKSNMPEFKWDIAGEGRLFADQDQLLISGQLYSLITAILLISFIMFLLWKNFLDVILTMVPNLSPVLGIFILMGILGIWLDMATAMIASVAIGIAVDDTIHVFHGYKKRIMNKCSVIFSLVQSFYKTGRALVVTTIILCSQFLLLSFSEFVPTSHFGLLTAFGLFMALLFDMVLLPALIVLFYNRFNQK